jgi:hypothetical protein
VFLVVPPIFIGGFSCEERSDEAISAHGREMFNAQYVNVQCSEGREIEKLILEH